MTVEENKATIRRIIEELWNRGNLALIPELFDPDCARHGQGGRVFSGHDGIKQMVTLRHADFPDLVMMIDDLIGEGDKVVCYWTFHGTHAGEPLSASLKGKKVAYTGITISSFVGGRVREMWVVSDSLTFSQQLGFVPPTD